MPRSRASFARVTMPSTDQRETPGRLATGCSTPSPSTTNSGQTRSAGVSTVSAWRRRLHPAARGRRSEEHTSELQSLMRISYAVFCLKKKQNERQQTEEVQ